MSVDLNGKVALITGGSRGLGKAMALAIAECGADVVISSRKIDECEKLCEQIRTIYGRRAFGYAAHVGHWDELEGLVDASYDAMGHVDILVNNAGLSPLYPRLVEISEDLYDKVFGVNLKGPFRLSALVGERMMADRGGSIINISSIAAVRPTPNELPYAAAKAGLHVMTMGFAQDLGPTVRVNAIMAGPFLTDISKAWDMDQFNEVATQFALRRAGQPQEIVGAALYFASDASSFTTGSILAVDGGSSIARM
jgi:NAD(P)-dependent dehydrogenase (short-subunit alcohol dehydrogenase family)